MYPMPKNTVKPTRFLKICPDNGRVYEKPSKSGEFKLLAEVDSVVGWLEREFDVEFTSRKLSALVSRLESKYPVSIEVG